MPGAWFPSDPFANASKMRVGDMSLRVPAWKRLEINVEAAPVVFASEL